MYDTHTHNTTHSMSLTSEMVYFFYYMDCDMYEILKRFIKVRDELVHPSKTDEEQVMRIFIAHY